MNGFSGTKNAEVRYSLMGYSQYRKNFTLDPVTGELKPTKPIDFEALVQQDIKTRLTSYPVILQVNLTNPLSSAVQKPCSKFRGILSVPLEFQVDRICHL